MGRLLRNDTGPFTLTAARFVVAGLIFAVLIRRLPVEERRPGRHLPLLIGMGVTARRSNWFPQPTPVTVGVSIDSGEFRPALLDRPLSPFAWVRWRYDWQNPAPGGHTVVVRTIDGNGEEQTAFVMGPHPEGASGWHRIRVTI